MNPSTTQARVVVDELIRGGVRDVVLCPGSRNAPLAFALQDADRSGRIRRAVNPVIGAPILAQQVDIPSMLARDPPSDPWLAGYLGYRWNPTRDVAAWRRQRIAQTAAVRGVA